MPFLRICRSVGIANIEIGLRLHGPRSRWCALCCQGCQPHAWADAQICWSLARFGGKSEGYQLLQPRALTNASTAVAGTVVPSR